MKFVIRHEGQGRLRVHLDRPCMSYREADVLQAYLEKQSFVQRAKVYSQTADVTVCYEGSKTALIRLLQHFDLRDENAWAECPAQTGRELNETYKEKLLTTVLDATAIGVFMLRGDIGTASSIMLLLTVGEILEEWTHKKSVGDLARSMSLKATKVWLVDQEGKEVLVDSRLVKPKDLVCIHMGNVIPFDGEVTEGEALVNQASFTGESLAVRKTEGSSVYAGTVLEEGELTICVRQAAGSSRYEQIVGINASLILCGVTGVLQPTTSALLHNTSTIAISLSSMKNLLDQE